MKKFIIILNLIIISFNYQDLDACTSFAVYSNDTVIYYGMNFDYPYVEMRFSVTGNDTLNFFHMEFWNNGNYSSTVGMNSRGFFSSCQYLYPQVNEWHTPGDNEVMIGELYYRSLILTDSTNSIVNYFDTSKTWVIHYTDVTLHNIFADKYGNAIVLEVGDTTPLITYPDNDFLVMANFPNNVFAGQPYTDVTGAGADRYIAAYEYILANKEDFNFNDALETLNRSKQSSGGYPTQCSFVFDPLNLEVFIILRQNFDKIWKVDLYNETIETYLGFDFYQSLDIGGNAILASTLENINSTTDLNNNEQTEKVLNVYPNPFNNSIYISNSNHEHLDYKIFNIPGKCISHGIVKANDQIQLDFLKNGFYWIGLYNKNQELVYYDKLFKCNY